MDVPIQNVIGTVALIALIVGVGLAYAMYTSSVEADAMKQELKQIAENVALNIVEISNLLNFASNPTSNSTLIKTLELPDDLTGRAYAIQILNQTTEGNGCFVRAFLVSMNSTFSDSQITINSMGYPLELATSFHEELDVRYETSKVQPSDIVYAGPEEIYDSIRRIVVWAWAGSGFPMVGIGTWKTGG